MKRREEREEGKVIWGVEQSHSTSCHFPKRNHQKGAQCLIHKNVSNKVV